MSTPESACGRGATAGQHTQLLQESEHGFPSPRSSSGQSETHTALDAVVFSAPHALSGASAKTGPAENWKSRRMATTTRIVRGYPNLSVNAIVRPPERSRMLFPMTSSDAPMSAATPYPPEADYIVSTLIRRLPRNRLRIVAEVGLNVSFAGIPCPSQHI